MKLRGSPSLLEQACAPVPSSHHHMHLMHDRCRPASLASPTHGVGENCAPASSLVASPRSERTGRRTARYLPVTSPSRAFVARSRPVTRRPWRWGDASHDGRDSALSSRGQRRSRGRLETLAENTDEPEPVNVPAALGHG